MRWMCSNGVDDVEKRERKEGGKKEEADSENKV
jgi:hypothetical protein